MVYFLAHIQLPPPITSIGHTSYHHGYLSDSQAGGVPHLLDGVDADEAKHLIRLLQQL